MPIKKKEFGLVEHDDKTGKIVKEQFLDTSHVCTPIYAYQFKEGEDEPVIPEGSQGISRIDWQFRMGSETKS